MPNVFIISTGSEITTGNTIDTNGPYLSKELIQIGFKVLGISSIPDSPTLLYDFIKNILERVDVDLVIMTGGLGPTEDDHTINVLSKIFEKKIIEDKKSFEKLKKYSSEKNTKINFEISKLQTRVLEDAIVLENELGFAPAIFFAIFSAGFPNIFLTNNQNKYFCAMPGVPREMKKIYETQLLPKLKNFFLKDKNETNSCYREFCFIYEVKETFLQKEFLDIIKNLELQNINKPIDFVWGVSPYFGYIKVFWESSSINFNNAIFANLEKIFNENILKTSASILFHELCLSKNIKIGTAESCTGGYVAKLITDTPSSSKYFYNGIICYNEEIKIKELKVNPEIISKHGVVSEECAIAMASGLINKYNLDYALSVTGLAGPGGGTQENPVGTVYLGFASNKSKTKSIKIFSGLDRHGVREYTANLAIFYFYKYILQN